MTRRVSQATSRALPLRRLILVQDPSLDRDANGRVWVAQTHLPALPLVLDAVAHTMLSLYQKRGMYLVRLRKAALRALWGPVAA